VLETASILTNVTRQRRLLLEQVRDKVAVAAQERDMQRRELRGALRREERLRRDRRRQLLENDLELRHRAVRGELVQRRLAIDVDGGNIGAIIEQRGERSAMAVERGVHDRRALLVVARVEHAELVGFGLDRSEENVETLVATIHRGPVNRHEPVLGGGPDITAVRNQLAQTRVRALTRRPMQRGHCAVSRLVDARTSANQQATRGGIAGARSQEQTGALARRGEINIKLRDGLPPTFNQRKLRITACSGTLAQATRHARRGRGVWTNRDVRNCTSRNTNHQKDAHGQDAKQPNRFEIKSDH
jgi:hypothetical protein